MRNHLTIAALAALLAAPLSLSSAARADGDASKPAPAGPAPAVPTAPTEGDEDAAPPAVKPGAGAAKKPAKADQAAIAKVKRLLDKAGAEEKKRAKLEAAGKTAEAKAAQDARDAALAEAKGVDRQSYFDGLGRAVVGSSPSEARVLASSELVAMKEPICAAAIVKGFVREADKPTRIAESKHLLAINAPDTAMWFAATLNDKDSTKRIRAMQGMSLFRDRRSADVLVQFIQILAGGFGGAACEFTTDRSYVSGWQMISGGTGLTVVEVADPEVDVMREGVSMEVKVRMVEMKFAVGLLQDLTGQSIGADVMAWKSWLAANPDWKLAPSKTATTGTK